jgi:uncharacterized membrane protein
MLTLGFVNVVFASHLSFIILDRRENFYQDKNFWLLLIAFLISILVTTIVIKVM